MRVSLPAVLLFGGLAACTSGQPMNAPPASPAAVQAPAGNPPPPPGMAGGFDGHYVGTGVSSLGRFCSNDQKYDFTVANNEISGTVSVSVQRGRGKSAATVHSMRSDLTGSVGPGGQATLHLHPSGAYGPGGSVSGQFADGRFTGHGGAPCERTITATRE